MLNHLRPETDMNNQQSQDATVNTAYAPQRRSTRRTKSPGEWWIAHTAYYIHFKQQLCLL